MATVFIVEDDAMVCLLAEALAQSEGYETLTAASLSQAKTVIESDEDFDILFTDLNLLHGKDDGLEVGYLVAQLRPGTPVLYTGGRRMTADLQARLCGRHEFLSKPYTDDMVTDAIPRLLAH